MVTQSKGIRARSGFLWFGRHFGASGCGQAGPDVGTTTKDQA